MSLLLLTQYNMNTIEKANQNTITNLTSNIDALEINNIYLRETITSLNQNISTLENTIFYQQSIIEEQNTSINYTKEQLSLLQNGTTYSLHNPTYAEAKRFVALDCTDSYEYKENIFDCDEFATMLNNNAESIGIRCGFVIIEFDDAAHALNAFNTLDEGIIFIEPQTDEELLHLNEGDAYWSDCFEINYGSQLYNDTIYSINIIW